MKSVLKGTIVLLTGFYYKINDVKSMSAFMKILGGQNLNNVHLFDRKLYYVDLLILVNSAGKLICRSAFMYMNAIGDFRLRALLRHYKEDGGDARSFLYKGRNKLSLNLDDSRMILKFLEQAGEVHTLDLPGRLPGSTLRD